MKILNVNMSLDPATGGGTAERTFQMSRFLARIGIECTILTTDLGLDNKRIEALQGIKVVPLPCFLHRFYIPRFSLREIRNLVASHDIIHLMGHWTFINALVYSIANHLHKSYVVCPAGALPMFGRSRQLKKVYNELVGRRMIQNAAGHVAITKDEIAHFRAYDVPADCISVIPNGIDRENYYSIDDQGFRSKHDLGDSPFILFVGRLNFIKGPDILMQAFLQMMNQYPEYHLVFAGPDEGMLPLLKQMVYAHQAEGRVRFTGYLGGVDKSQAYHAAGLLVIPSRQEAMSIVVLEAGITGTPVVMTNRCGFDDIDGIGGGAIVPASVEGITNGLLKVLRDPEKMKSMGRNLKAYVEEHFLWDGVVHKYQDLFCRILGEPA